MLPRTITNNKPQFASCAFRFLSSVSGGKVKVMITSVSFYMVVFYLVMKFKKERKSFSYIIQRYIALLNQSTHSIVLSTDATSIPQEDVVRTKLEC